MAPTMALPMTPPSCRIVFKTPDAAPASRGSTRRMVTVVMGAKVQPRPSPAMMNGREKVRTSALSDADQDTRRIPNENSVSPAIRMYFPPHRSQARPEGDSHPMEAQHL